ncbi:MAG: FtsH protease activity modulator HflK, partial [bacterium]
MKRTPEDFFEGEFLKNIQSRFRGQKPAKLWSILIIAVVLIWVLSGIYIVSPGEMAVVQRFGKMTKTATSGPHWHIPRPFEKVNVVKVDQIRSMESGFRTTVSGGTSRVRPSPIESLMITGDENLVKILVVIQYRISNLPDYLFKVWDPEGRADQRTLRDAAETALRGVVGSMEIDDILTTGRAKVQDDTRIHLQALMDLYQTGLMITAVKLQAVDPPEQVQAAFKDVVSAKEDRERIINEAQSYKEDLLPKARGEAEQM